jgi:hypothetical protein
VRATAAVVDNTDKMQSQSSLATELSKWMEADVMAKIQNLSPRGYGSFSNPGVFYSREYGSFEF